MKLHEYQAKQLLASAQIPIPRGRVATHSSQTAEIYTQLQRDCGNATPFVCNVKAQLHAGGRGKAGGILTVHSAAEANEAAARLLGQRLVTKQTGPDGLPVSAVLLEESVSIAQELYVAVTIDRFHACPTVLASRRGGMEIEEVAVSEPQAIVREPFDIDEGLTKIQAMRVSTALGLTGTVQPMCAQIVRSLWKIFAASDASLVEINPLVITTSGQLVALDAKITLDDNALFRHPDTATLRDESQEEPLELKASRIGISYVGLDGNIGCLVNGAGLAMATNDIIKLSGGTPANFLDVGGGANVEQVTNAFAIILADPKVTAVLVNIFGGIMRCDWVAQGLLNATAQLEVKVPIVVRLQGTNVEEGRRLLTQAKRLNLISIDELGDAARNVVELARR